MLLVVYFSAAIIALFTLHLTQALLDPLQYQVKGAVSPQVKKALTVAQSWHIPKWANPDFSQELAGPALEQGCPRVCRVIP